MFAEQGKDAVTVMNSANSEIVTAAVLVIGDEILSGRTKDKNIGYIADYLTAIGIDLKEVRVVSDDESAIVEALNALRAKYTYVFTTGGIGPTHDDITADCIAKAFGVALPYHPEAVAILKERLAKTGGELNEARMRMARIPEGAALVVNKVSGAPGFWIGNVITMAGIPTVMQSMLDEVAPKLKTGTKLHLGNHPRRRQGRRRRHRAGRHRQGASRHHHRQLSVLRRQDRAQHQYRGARARRRQARRRQGRGGRHAGAQVVRQRKLRHALKRDEEVSIVPKRAHKPTARRARRKSFRSPGISSIATRARWPGGCTRPARSRPSSPSRAAGWCRRRSWRASSNVRMIDTVCVTSYDDDKNQGALKLLKGIAPEIVALRAQGKRVLIVDDLVDTGNTARVVRDLLPAAHFATVYAKPMGRPLVDTFITEVSQDTWIYFPWDTGLAFVPPIREGGE